MHKALTTHRNYTRSDLISLIILSAAIIALISPILWAMITTRLPYPDFADHLEFGRKVLRGESLRSPVPQFLFFLLAGLLDRLPLIPLGIAGLIVATSAYVLAGVVLYHFIRPFIAMESQIVTSLLRIVSVISLILAGSINLLSVGSTGFYMGYIHPSVYHNPTTTMLRPFAIMLMAYAVKCFMPNKVSASWAEVLAVGGLSVLTIIAKPNYTLSLLPALAIVSLFCLVRGWHVNWKLLVLGIVLPSVGMLAIQYILTYTALEGASSGLIFAPLVVVNVYSDHVLSKFLLSIAFPLAVYLLNIRAAVRSTELNLAWLAFLFGVAQMYLFAESGDRLLHGNFFWSAYITLFVLYIVSFLFFLQKFTLKRSRPLDSASNLLIGGVAALHLISGIVWYLFNLSLSPTWPWWTWSI